MIPPRPARLRDTYEAECPCGETVESHERKAQCPRCGRELFFEWGRTALVCVDRFPEGEKP
jgi:uncharacterized paraquat-inducible protein A